MVITSTPFVYQRPLTSLPCTICVICTFYLPCTMYRVPCTIVMHHVPKLTTHHTMTPLPSGYVFMNYVVTTCHGVMLQYLISFVSGLSSVSTTTMLISFGKVKLSLCILGLHCVLLSQTLASSNHSNLHVYCFVLRTTDRANKYQT